MTIIAPYPARHLQIILRAYKSPAEVAATPLNFTFRFFLDSIMEPVPWALMEPQFGQWSDSRELLQKGLILWRHSPFRYILIDPSRRSTTYESRLRKYATRGPTGSHAYVFRIPSQLSKSWQKTRQSWYLPSSECFVCQGFEAAFALWVLCPSTTWSHMSSAWFLRWNVSVLTYRTTYISVGLLKLRWRFLSCITPAITGL